VRTGKGKLIYVEGDEYNGNWENDKPHGYGEFKQMNGCVYKGEWKNEQ